MRRRRGVNPFAHRGARADKQAFAILLRNAPTRAESILWQALRRKATGYKFRRQHVVAGFIIDFYCPERLLAIEVDGPVHGLQARADAARDGLLATLGILVVRVTNQQVLSDVLATLRVIEHACAERLPSPRNGGKGRG